MFYRIRNRAREHLFDYRTRGVLATRPMEIDSNSELTIVTMLCHQDIRKYLIAIKSLYSKIGHGEITVIDDGTLTTADKGTISSQVKGSRIIHISSINTGPCPRGGCWERLCFIIRVSQTRYVIQMDADTLAIGNLEEVLTCVRSNESFALGTDAGRSFVTLREAAVFLRDHPGVQVSIVAEKLFASYPNCDSFRYVRGSAGFAGFAKGGFSRERLEEFSGRMSGMLGARWKEWGTEQIASNFAVANSPDAVVLPYPKYSCFHPDVDPAQCVFLHFIGTHRFRHTAYDRLALSVINSFGN